MSLESLLSKYGAFKQEVRETAFSNLMKQVAAADAVATMASGMVAEPVSGLAGGVGTALTGDPNVGADIVNRTQQMLTREPVTNQGGQYLENVGTVMEPIANAFEGVSRGAGDVVYDVTGSPVAAAAAYSAPTAMLELMGLKGARAAGAGRVGPQMEFGDIGGQSFGQAGKWVLRDPNNPDSGVILEGWHGSPHDFERFDMSQIGKGEGAQTYGHGLYFADEKAVGEAYRKALSEERDLWVLKNKKGEVIKPETEAESIAARYINDPEELEIKADELPEVYSEAFDVLEGWVDSGVRGEAGGVLYKTNIDITPEQLLDWDKPLGEQPKAFKDAVDDFFALRGVESYTPKGENTKVYIGQGVSGDTKFRDIYNKMIEGAPTKKGVEIGSKEDFDNAYSWLTNELNSRGLKGIQYNDALSRSKDGGTKNYVIFDDSLIKIMDKSR